MSTMVFNPFPGLRPFQMEEAHLFFGRDGQSVELLRLLREHRFVAVVGPSGSGKSSLVHAGLLPALHGGFMRAAGSRWRVAVLRPGADPIGNLGRALADPDVLGNATMDERDRCEFMDITLRRGSLGLVEAVEEARLAGGENLLVVVDQFEEIFRFERVSADTEFRDDAAAFVKLLLEASAAPGTPVYVLLTMRSDYLGDCAQFRDLPESINRGQYLIPRMTRDERRVAITGPAAVGGGEIAPRLVNRILNDVGAEPDQLPILQHALMRAWDRWQSDRTGDEPLDLHHYEAIGGAQEALALHAEEAYADLDAEGQQLAERILRRLTERGTDNRDIRRPTRFAELCAIVNADRAAVAAVIEVFRRPGRSFLMPPPDVDLRDDTLVDISHESFIRGWERLQFWVAAEAEAARRFVRLADTAALWEAGRAGPLKDPELSHMLEWWERDAPTAEWARAYHPGFDAAATFLKRSRDEAERERKQEAARENARKMWRRVAIGALAAGLVVAVGFAFKASSAEREARASELRAQQAAAAADSAAREARASALAALRSEQAAQDSARVAQREREESARRAEEALAARREAEATRTESESVKRIYSSHMMSSLDVLQDSAYQRAELAPYYDRLLSVSDETANEVRELNARSAEALTLQARLRVHRAYLNRLQARTAGSTTEEADSAALEASAAEAARDALDLADQVRGGASEAEYRSVLLWTYYNAGELLRQLADTAGVARAVRDGLAMAGRAGRDSTNSVLQWHARLNMLHSDLMLARGDTAAAVRSAERGVQVARRLARQLPVTAARRLLSAALDAHGYLLWRQQRFAGAFIAYREELAIDSTIFADDQSVESRRDMRWSWGRIGHILMEMDSFPASERALLRQLELARSIDPAEVEEVDRSELDRSRRLLLMLYERWALAESANDAQVLNLQRRRVDVNRDRVAENASESVLLDLVTALEGVQRALPEDSVASRIRILRELLATRERIAELEDTPQSRLGVALAAEALGFVLGEADSAAAAVGAFQRSLKIRRADWREWLDGTEGAARNQLATTLGNLSWFLLFARRPADALAAAEEGLRWSPPETWIQTNRAHALLLLGRSGDAATIYQAYRGQRIHDGRQDWVEVIEADVTLLSGKGVFTPAQARTVRGWIARDAAAAGADWDAAAVAGEWTGTYTCAQGATSLTLTLRPGGPLGQVSGRFAFGPHPDNPSVAAGAYEVIGWYAKDGALDLAGRRWVEQPKGYFMVGITARLDREGHRLSGTIPECVGEVSAERT